MSNSKKDIEILFKLFQNLLSNISLNQYEELINGTSELKVVKKNIDSGSSKEYLELINEINKSDLFESKLSIIGEKLQTKKELKQMADFLDISLKSRDKNDEIILKILDKANEMEEEIEYRILLLNNKEEDMDSLYHYLQNTMDINEARDKIKNSEFLNNKKNLIEFARKLDVYPDRNSSIENLVDQIVKSVVEAKLRSYKIRQKL